MIKPSANKLFFKAKSFLNEGNIKEAIKIYKTVLKFFPKNKRAKDGIEYLQKQIEKNNNKTNLQKKTAELIKLYNQGRFSNLIYEAKKLTNDHPEAFIIWNLLGAAYKSLERADEAIRSFKKVIELNPKYADGYNNLGVILQEQGNLDESIKYSGKISPSLSENGIAF